MATEILASLQSTGEIRTHYVDFSQDLPTGVTIVSGTATHTPPIGTAVTPTLGVIASNVIPVIVPALLVTGRHTITVIATLSSGDLSIAQLIIPVQWDSVRPTMTSLIAEVRAMTDTGSNDYKIGGIPFWTDKQIQDELDRVKVQQNMLDLEPVPTYEIGTTTYLKFISNIQNWEGSATLRGYTSGTSGALGTITSGYTFDAMRGEVDFIAAQGTLGFSLTGNTFDLNQVAAAIWRKKSGHYAAAYDFSTDNHNLRRSQLVQQAREMAQYYEGLTGPGYLSIERGDC